MEDHIESLLSCRVQIEAIGHSYRFLSGRIAKTKKDESSSEVKSRVSFRE